MADTKGDIVAGVPRSLETHEQEALVQWFKLAYPGELLFAIPNDLVRGEKHAIMMSKRGLVGGIPDLMLAAARRGTHGLFIEMKKPQVFGEKLGIVSPKQKAIIAHLISRDYAAVVAWGWDQAREIIEEYMG